MPPRKKRGSTEDRRNRREYLWFREEGCCFWCTRPVSVSEGIGDRRPDRATVDHIRLAADGGTSSLSNTVLCCGGCNDERADTSAMVWADRCGQMDKLIDFLSGNYDRRGRSRVVAQRNGISVPNA